jgi:hypothetical protein
LATSNAYEWASTNKLIYNFMEKYYFKTSKISAEAYFLNGKMTIIKGSVGNKHCLSSFSELLNNIRKNLFSSGVLIEQGDKILFKEDFTCTSPSQASALINGSSSNGLLAWKDCYGNTLKSRIKEENT